MTQKQQDQQENLAFRPGCRPRKRQVSQFPTLMKADRECDSEFFNRIAEQETVGHLSLNFRS